MSAPHCLTAGHSEIAQRVNYDPVSGAFTWAVSAPGITKGASAGSVTSRGYLSIKVLRKQHRAHRLAWFISHGTWPCGEIDHIDGNPLNNRLANLRVVDRAGNSQNRRKAFQSHKSCGLQGVAWNKQHQRWQAKIMARKVRHHLGYFDDPHTAHCAYLNAKAALHIGGPSH